jgi:hypothetical protein
MTEIIHEIFPQPGKTCRESCPEKIRNILTCLEMAGPGMHGLKAYGMSTTDYLALPGVTDAFARAKHPGNMPTDPDKFRIWKFQFDRYETESNAVSKERTGLYNSLDAITKNLCCDENGHLLTIYGMVQVLTNQYGCMTSSEIDELVARLDTPYNPIETMELFVHKHDMIHRLLKQQKQPKTDYEIISAMSKAIKATSALRYTPFFRDWAKQHPTPSTQDYASFRKDLLLESHNVDAAITTASAGYGAAVESKAPEQTFTLTEMKQLLAAAAAGRAPPPTVKRAGKGDIVYCFTHGYGYHNGAACYHPDRPGHQNDARDHNHYKGGNIKGFGRLPTA